MSVTISTRKVVLSPHALRRALSSNYNPKSRKNLIQYSSTPQRKGEINPKRKREIRSMLQNYITAYFALIRKKNSGQQSVKCPSALYGRTAFTQTLCATRKKKLKFTDERIGEIFRKYISVFGRMENEILLGIIGG